MLNEKYIALSDLLKQLTQYSKLNSSNPQFDSNLHTKQLTCLNEDIHWILLLSGFIFFEINSDVNECLISNEIMKYSVNWSQYTDKNFISKLFSTLNPDQNSLTLTSSNTPLSLSLIETKLTDLSQVDPMVLIFFNVFQLCELETQMFSLKMLDYLSPQVSKTIMWFLKEMVRSYLFMKEKNYEELSPTLQGMFGADTEIGVVITNFLMRKLSANFYIWSSENSSTIQTAKLLLEMVKNKDMNTILLQNKQFWSMSNIVCVNDMPWMLLSSNAKKLIIKSLVVSLSNANMEIQMHFFGTTLKPIADRYDSLALLKYNDLHTEKCIKEVMSLIETFNGIIEGSTRSMVKDLIPFLLPRLQQNVQLLDAYKSYGEIVELILEMFNCVIEKVLMNLNDESWTLDAKNQIYGCFLSLIQIFSKHNSGKKSIEANVEEDYYNDLLLFMILLNKLHSVANQTEDSRFLANQPKTTGTH